MIIFFVSCNTEKQLQKDQICPNKLNLDLLTLDPSFQNPFQKDPLEWYKNYQKRYEIYMDRLNQLYFFLQQYPNCREKAKILFREEQQIGFKINEIYFKHLEKHLQQYITTHQIFQGNQILEDFRENKNTVFESYYNFTFFMLKHIEDNKNYQEQIKKWYEVYSIIIYELFLQLPEDFKKEWFKKF